MRHRHRVAQAALAKWEERFCKSIGCSTEESYDLCDMMCSHYHRLYVRCSVVKEVGV